MHFGSIVSEQAVLCDQGLDAGADLFIEDLVFDAERGRGRDAHRQSIAGRVRGCQIGPPGSGANQEGKSTGSDYE
jgi:hypothetical protein